MSVCKNCGSGMIKIVAGLCHYCALSRVKELEDSLVRIGKLCLHTPASPIWDEVRSMVGEDGEKRLT